MKSPHRTACCVLLGLACLLASGCGDSRYAQDVAAKRFDLAPQNHAATIHDQLLDQELMASLLAHGDLKEVRILMSDRTSVPVLAEVSKLEGLSHLALLEVELTDEELAVLAAAKQLTSLELIRTGITGEGLKHLHGLPIKKLSLREPRLTPAGLQLLLGFPELEELELYTPNTRTEDIPSLAGLSRLTRLTIFDARFSYREHGGLKCLDGAHSLRYLELSGSNLNDRSLKVVSTLSGLEELDIPAHRLTQEGLGQLASLGQLRSTSIAPAVDSNSQPVLTLAEADAELPGVSIRFINTSSPELQRSL